MLGSTWKTPQLDAASAGTVQHRCIRGGQSAGQGDKRAGTESERRASDKQASMSAHRFFRRLGTRSDSSQSRCQSTSGSDRPQWSRSRWSRRQRRPPRRSRGCPECTEASSPGMRLRKPRTREQKEEESAYAVQGLAVLADAEGCASRINERNETMQNPACVLTVAFQKAAAAHTTRG